MFQVRGRDDYLMNASCSWCQLLKTPPSPGFFLFIHGYISSPYVLSSTIHLTTFEFHDISSEKKKRPKKDVKKNQVLHNPNPPRSRYMFFLLGCFRIPDPLCLWQVGFFVPGARWNGVTGVEWKKRRRPMVFVGDCFFRKELWRKKWQVTSIFRIGILSFFVRIVFFFQSRCAQG